MDMSKETLKGSTSHNPLSLPSPFMPLESVMYNRLPLYCNSQDVSFLPTDKQSNVYGL
jgi:hypothetical protein